MSFSNESSRLFGLLAGFSFPKFLQNFINENYVKYFKIDLSEFKAPQDYESLNALFTRSLVKNRTLEEGFISPSDGRVFQSGEAFLAQNEYFAFSIKAHTYSVEELLRENFEKEELKNGLDYVNIYLSPKDYHRYHAPCDLEILKAVYTSGALFSVNERHLRKIPNLYTKNERLSLKCKSEKGFIFWLVFVGAQNVGKMRFHFDESIQSNAKYSHNFSRVYENLKFKKGDELGLFELGSTIVLITQKNFLTFKIKENETLKFGKKIADFV